MSKRSAADFLSMLSKIDKTTIKAPKSKAKKDEDSTKEIQNLQNQIDPNVDLDAQLPEIEMKGDHVTFNEWFNEAKHDFNKPRPKFETYKSDFGVALSTTKTIPDLPIKLHPLLAATKECKKLIQDKMCAPVFDYMDFFWSTTSEEFPDRLRKISALHVLNHVFNDWDIKQKREHGSMTRDCGFTPTTVLVIAASKLQAFKFVNDMLEFIPEDIIVEHDDKFRTEYGATLPEGVRKAKPADWLQYFGGNNDQEFKTGIRFFGDKISLCQKISKSQIVIASPLSIMLHEDRSYLSSIEILVLDSLDFLEMQNMKRLNEVIQTINQKPTTVEETDWSRLRTYFSDKQHPKMRQNIGYSTLLTPDMISLFRGFPNIRGSMIVKQKFTKPLLHPGIERNYKRLATTDISKIGDDFYKVFQNRVLPQIKQFRATMAVNGRTIIVFSSSYQFYRARGLLESTSVIFLELGDEATDKDSVRMRKAFSEDPNAVMIMTERYYFHYRPKYFDYQRVIFFGAPMFPQFVTALGASVPTTIYFTKFDILSLERICGESMANRLIRDDVYLV